YDKFLKSTRISISGCSHYWIFCHVTFVFYSTIPNLFKIGFMFFFGLIITTTIGNIELTFDGFYLFLLMKEALVGLAIGLFAYIILSAIQIAGGFIDFQMGFAIANVIDPQTGAQSPLTGQYFYIISLLFLLSVDGH